MVEEDKEAKEVKEVEEVKEVAGGQGGGGPRQEQWSRGGPRVFYDSSTSLFKMGLFEETLSSTKTNLKPRVKYILSY